MDWVKDVYEDDMGRGRVKTAQVRSTNTLSLDSHTVASNTPR
jgi:hypothetical protein